MFHKAFFANTSREEIKKKIHIEGFYPKVITDPPGYIYELHEHPETKFLVCLEGSMQVTFTGKIYDFEPGDKLSIDGNTNHAAIVGDKGCVFFLSEKIV